MIHTQAALDLFAQRFHCSQSVLAAFAEELGLSRQQALRLGACFGGGMCKGEVCGACVGALMAIGLKHGQYLPGDTESRLHTNELTAKYLDLFAEKNGSYMCRELLGCDLSTKEGGEYAREHNLFTEFCPKMVESAVEIAKPFVCD